MPPKDLIKSPSASDNTSVATVTLSADPLVGIVDPVGEGTANISAKFSYEDGSEPPADPEFVTVTVAKIDEGLTLS